MDGGVREIPLSKGLVALVDAADFDWLNQWRWHYHQSGYAFRINGKRSGGDGKPIMMHRLILAPPIGMVGDHANGDRLDNRRANLRNCTPKENARNGAKRSAQPYKGVSPEPTSPHLWRARICVDGKLRHLGAYDTPEEAARAYDAAAISDFGAFARINLSDSTAVPPPRRKPVLARGERVKGAKLCAEVIPEIRRRHRAGESMYRLARAFSVTDNTIKSVVRGTSWRHVSEAA